LAGWHVFSCVSGVWCGAGFAVSFEFGFDTAGLYNTEVD